MMKSNNKYLEKIFYLIILVIFINSIYCNELKIKRIIKGKFENDLFVLDCVDTNNKAFKIITFNNGKFNNDSLKTFENIIIDMNLDILPQEFILEEIFPSFLPINDLKNKIYNPRFQHNLSFRVDNIEYFNTNDTFYYSNCLNGLTYIPKCNDSTNLKNILKLGYIIDKNGSIIKKIDDSLFDQNNRGVLNSKDYLNKYIDSIKINNIDTLKR